MTIKSLKKITLITLVFSLFVGFADAQNGTVEVNQNEDIDKLISLKSDINKKADYYKIQIYNGSRSGAQKSKTEFNSIYDKWPVEMKFETPNYKIWVGNFKNRLEADRALLEIKKNFGNAFIFTPKKK